MRDELLEISASFPPPEQAVAGETIEIRARAVLSILLQGSPSPATDSASEKGSPYMRGRKVDEVHQLVTPEPKTAYLAKGEPSEARAKEGVTKGQDGTNAELCPNCLKPYTSDRSPYCSTQCREEAAFVRQLRSSVLDQSLKDHDKQVALGQKFWHLIGGGYPLRQTLAPPSSLKQLYKRSNNRCEICGAPATTFDHTGSG